MFLRTQNNYFHYSSILLNAINYVQTKWQILSLLSISMDVIVPNCFDSRLWIIYFCDKHDQKT